MIKKSSDWRLYSNRIAKIRHPVGATMAKELFCSIGRIAGNAFNRSFHTVQHSAHGAAAGIARMRARHAPRRLVRPADLCHKNSLRSDTYGI